jgi:hypothetical protein
MSIKGPASLTSSLIVTKGNAAPAGLLAMNRKRNSSRPVIGPKATKPHLPHDDNTPPSPAQRSRLTLRLDPDRHLKIKLAAAHLNLSLQEMMIDALDSYLADVRPINIGGVCNCLDGSVPAPASAKNHSGG